MREEVADRCAGEPGGSWKFEVGQVVGVIAREVPDHKVPPGSTVYPNPVEVTSRFAEVFESGFRVNKYEVWDRYKQACFTFSEGELEALPKVCAGRLWIALHDVMLREGYAVILPREKGGD